MPIFGQNTSPLYLCRVKRINQLKKNRKDMANIHQSIAELVGKTPLLQLNGYNKAKNLKANIIAK